MILSYTLQKGSNAKHLPGMGRASIVKLLSKKCLVQPLISFATLHMYGKDRKRGHHNNFSLEEPLESLKSLTSLEG